MLTPLAEWNFSFSCFTLQFGNPRLFSFSEASRLVKEQLSHPWASCWPGPLGAFVLDEIGEDRIREMAVFKHEQVTRRQTLQVDFYVGVKAERMAQHKKFAMQMKKCASVVGCEMKHEFYLARHEARLEQGRAKRRPSLEDQE